jgi:hypothetical protein
MMKQELNFIYKYTPFSAFRNYTAGSNLEQNPLTFV